MIKCENFGVEKVYVITDFTNDERRNHFIQKWENFIDFEYEFIPAIWGRDIDICELINTNILSSYYIDKVGILSKNQIGCSLAHISAWKRIIDDNVETAMVMEDDAVPTYEFANWIYNGWLKDSVEFVKKNKWDIFYWGKNDLDLSVINLTNTVGIFNSKSNGAHAYCLTNKSAHILYENRFPINNANDIFIDTNSFVTDRKSTNQSLIRQMCILLGKRFFDITDENYIFRTTTGVNPMDNVNDNPLLKRVSSDIVDYIDSVYMDSDRNIVFKFKSK
jgi:glycosyl transferase family 25